MSPKRASVPQDTYGNRPSALDKLTGRAPQNIPAHQTEKGDQQFPSPSVEQENRKTGEPQDSNTVLLQSAEKDDSSTREKITFYLRPDQIDKLDELTLAYKRQTGKRLNRNALVRQLIDRCTLDMLLENNETQLS